MSKLTRTLEYPGRLNSFTPNHKCGINNKILWLILYIFVLVLYIFVNMEKYLSQSRQVGLSISTAHSFSPSRNCHHKCGNNNNILVTVLSEISL